MKLIPSPLDGWTYDVIKALRDRSVTETELFDFKFNLPDVDTLADLCCSFANTKGGFIIFGISEYLVIFHIPLSDYRLHAHSDLQKMKFRSRTNKGKQLMTLEELREEFQRPLKEIKESSWTIGKYFA